MISLVLGALAINRTLLHSLAFMPQNIGSQVRKGNHCWVWLGDVSGLKMIQGFVSGHCFRNYCLIPWPVTKLSYIDDKIRWVQDPQKLRVVSIF